MIIFQVGDSENIEDNNRTVTASTSQNETPDAVENLNHNVQHSNLVSIDISDVPIMDETNLDENLCVYLIPLAPDDDFSPSDDELESTLKTNEENDIGMLITDSSTNSVAVPSLSAAVTGSTSDISTTSRLKKAPVRKNTKTNSGIKKIITKKATVQNNANANSSTARQDVKKVRLPKKKKYA